MSNNGRLERMRALVLVLVVIIVLVAAATPVGVSAYLDKQIADVQIEIDCASARQNRVQLIALAEIAERLGIPHDFRIPTVPEECQ